MSSFVFGVDTNLLNHIKCVMRLMGMGICTNERREVNHGKAKQSQS